MTAHTIAGTRWHSPATSGMTTRLFTSALFAGLIAGLIAVLLQFLLMEPLILEGEAYETGAKVHFKGAQLLGEQPAPAPSAAPLAHDHAHDHDHAPENLWRRYSLAFAADFVIFVAWGLLMVAGFALVERSGHRVSVKEGILWGIAGYIAIQLSPALGLPPELPGTPAAALEPRQIWWVVTATTTAVGLAFLGYGGRLVYWATGVVLLIAPHLIPAPHLDGYSGVAPPELSGEFVAHSLAISLVVWVCLGLAAGYFWNRHRAA